MIGYLQSMWRCRYFWLSLVKMDLRTRYRRSILGMGWSLLHPIALTVIFCVVFTHLMMPQGGVARYAPYLLAGLATWNFILTSTLQGCHCFFLGESYIRQYPAPMGIYPLRTVLGALIHFLIALTVVVMMVWIIKGFVTPDPPPSAAALAAGAHAPRPDPTWRQLLLALPWLVPGILLLFLFAWSMAVLAGFANVYFQDTQHLSEVGFQILLYMTPILYEREMLAQRGFGWLADFNPITAFLDLVREPVLWGVPPGTYTFAVACLTVFVVMGSAIYTLSRCQRKLIFQL
jgi:lipopolysaccharide transport system permease protein